jgi:hypothetical protein
MAVTLVPYNAPSYRILSSDIDGGSVGGSVSGVSYTGASVYATDTHTWYTVLPDSTLELLYYNIVAGSSA